MARLLLQVSLQLEHQRLQPLLHDRPDLGKITTNEWFSPRQADGIHDRQLSENPVDFIQGQIPLRGHFPGITHDATGITPKCDGIR